MSSSASESTERTLAGSTCMAVDLGPTILWVLPWTAPGAAEALHAFVRPKGGNATETTVDAEVAAFLRRHGDARELPAHHSPAWTLDREVTGSSLQISSFLD